MKVTPFQIVQAGSAEGQMLYWSDAQQLWVKTEVNELFWDDVNKRVQPKALIIKNTAGDTVFYADEDEIYYTVVTSVPIEAGMVMGLWLFWGTYAAP